MSQTEGGFRKGGPAPPLHPEPRRAEIEAGLRPIEPALGRYR
jgi:hypothetical protein